MHRLIVAPMLLILFVFDLVACAVRFVLIELPVEIAGLIIVPIALLFCDEQAERLPTWASWFDEYDYGINGDPYWQGPDHANGHQREYAWRWKWLMRNRTNTFSKIVTGIERARITSVAYFGDRHTSNNPGRTGYSYVSVFIDSRKEYREHYLILKYPFLPMCLRVRIGHKLLDVVPNEAPLYAETRYAPDQLRAGRQYCQFVFVINPFMSFNG